MDRLPLKFTPEIYYTSIGITCLSTSFGGYRLLVTFNKIRKITSSDMTLLSRTTASRNQLLRLLSVFTSWSFVFLNLILLLHYEDAMQIGMMLLLTLLLLVHTLTFLQTFERIYYALNTGNIKITIARVSMFILAILSFSITTYDLVVFSKVKLISETFTSLYFILSVGRKILLLILYCIDDLIYLYIGLEVGSSVLMIKTTLLNKSSRIPSNNEPMLPIISQQDILKKQLRKKLYIAYSLFLFSDLIALSLFALSTTITNPLLQVLPGSWVPVHVFISFRL